jgi:NDP-4-keto-2,6-dideoxyhexose 3-C-methyltransferase
MLNCRICKSTNLIDILSLGNQYLSEFRSDNKKPRQFPLDLVMCGECNQVQLKDTVPPALLYTDNYGYRSGVNSTMRNHLKDLVNELIELANPQRGDMVIDIGSNDSTLLRNYPDWITRVGYDLVPKFGRDYYGTGIRFINAPFTVDNCSKPAKVITAISMFYDLDKPMDLMRDMAQCLDKRGIIVIQQNYLVDMLRMNGFDNIVSEHLTYNSVHSMERMVKPFGLSIFDVKVNDLNGGSFRTYICKEGDYRISKNVKTWLAEEKMQKIDDLKTYRAFANRIEGIRAELVGFIQTEKDAGKRTYIYGASTRGNTLLQYFKLDNILIDKAVERNPEKYGKFISSVGIPIISEEQARKEKPDYMLVLPWFFAQEFKNREVEYLKNGGALIFGDCT